MGKIILRDVNISINKLLAQDPEKNFDVEGDNFSDLKATLNQLGQDVATEFGVSPSEIKVKNATLKEDIFLVF